MSAFFTWLGNYLIGWIVLAYLCAAFLSALMWGRILRLNERPQAGEPNPCRHPGLTQNKGGVICLECRERVL